MYTRKKIMTWVAILIVTAIGFPPLTQGSASNAASPVLVFVSDGMRHDLMKQFVAEGVMPTYGEVLNTGVEGVKGMVPNVPPNTGPGWTALATGASPSVNGVTNNTFHDNTLPFSPFGVSAWSPGVNQAETIVQRAQASGLTVAVLAWQAFDPATLVDGPFVESYPDWLTGRGIVANYEVPLHWTNILSVGPFLSNSVVTMVPASGWSNVESGYSPAQETAFSITSFFGPILDYNVYVYDSTDDGATNYDVALVSPSKDGAQAVASLGAGEWSGSVDVSVSGLEGGFYLKLIDLEPDLSKFRLYFTPATRYRAFPQSLEDDLVANFDAIRPSDFSPYIIGLIDDQTFLEQHLHADDLLGHQVYPYIIQTYHPDLVLAGSEATDSIQHRLLALATPGTPVFDAANGAKYWDYIRQAYQGADSMLQALWDEMPEANVIVTSDHGFSNTWMAINANYLLETQGLYSPADLAGSQAVAYSAGGTSQIYINLQGRNPGGVVAPEEYDAVRQQIVNAFEALGPDVIEQVLLKEETADIATAMGTSVDMLHPDRTGDVVVFSAPPFQFDAPTAGEITSLTPIFGQHGFVPNGDSDRFATFAAAGPQIRHGKIPRATAVDLAPTVAYLLGIAPPAQSEGEILKVLQPSYLPLP